MTDPLTTFAAAGAIIVTVALIIALRPYRPRTELRARLRASGDALLGPVMPPGMPADIWTHWTPAQVQEVVAEAVAEYTHLRKARYVARARWSWDATPDLPWTP